MDKQTVEVVLDAAPGELTWQGYVDQLHLCLTPEAARRLARHLLLRVDAAPEAPAPRQEKPEWQRDE